MEQQNLQLMKKLVEDGHTVYTQQCQTPIYYKSFGITSIPELPYFIYAQTKMLSSICVCLCAHARARTCSPHVVLPH